MTSVNDQLSNEARRRFLARATGVATAAVVPAAMLAPSAQATPRATAVSDKVRYGMLVDTTKCADGCNDCVTACEAENGLDMLVKPEGADDVLWDMQRPRWIRSVKLKNNLTGRVTSLPMMCQHCEHPPCVDVCPTGASFRRADGIVMVDRHTCIGCRYCMMACPYSARTFIHENIEFKSTIAPRGKGCVESCNLCVHRRDHGGSTTACQDACKHEAIVFGDLNDPNSAVSKAMAKQPTVQIRADLKLNTGVRYTAI
ncbi:MAG: 4Fe-4S dicluster domain-containing protein [Gammaproteobacteria bacterium]|nr:4Fe-4S dicluster domain-containing protein [Gammaproteobacteria bacterium]